MKMVPACLTSTELPGAKLPSHGWVTLQNVPVKYMSGAGGVTASKYLAG